MARCMEWIVYPKINFRLSWFFFYSHFILVRHLLVLTLGSSFRYFFFFILVVTRIPSSSSNISFPFFCVHAFYSFRCHFSQHFSKSTATPNNNGWAPAINRTNKYLCIHTHTHRVGPSFIFISFLENSDTLRHRYSHKEEITTTSIV